MTKLCDLCRKRAAVYLDRKQRAICQTCRDRLSVKTTPEPGVQGELWKVEGLN